MPPKNKQAAAAAQQAAAGTSGQSASEKKAKKGAGTASGQTHDPVELERRIQQTRKQLQDTEKQIYNLETQYFESANPQGNAIRGYEGLLSSTTVSAKKAAFKNEDRIFSASSASTG